MYTTCLFCHGALGKNDAIEHFPVGRRLAFDAAKGRLWVVCRKCERWNLTPLEERWEAIEEGERLFASTKLRVSTDNIGLARVADGLELVRVGAPKRPEMAAWRYGDQFGRRRRKQLILVGGGIAVVGGLMIAGPLMGFAAGGSLTIYNLATSANTVINGRRVRARIAVDGMAKPLALRHSHLYGVAILGEGNDWRLRVPHDVRAPQTGRRREAWITLEGAAAFAAAGKLLPAINAGGGKPTDVRSAVHLVSEVSTPMDLFSRYTARSKVRPWVAKVGHKLFNLPPEVRLAMEMATHEETERRALEGELSLLEDAWREAEEIAGIADDMFVSDAELARLDAMKRGR